MLVHQMLMFKQHTLHAFLPLIATGCQPYTTDMHICVTDICMSVITTPPQAFASVAHPPHCGTPSFLLVAASGCCMPLQQLGTTAGVEPAGTASVVA